MKCFCPTIAEDIINDRFVYYNINPKGKKTSDCVIRAMSLALDIPYDEVVKLIIDNSDINYCSELNIECYTLLLDNYFNLVHMIPNNTKSVIDVAYDFQDEILLIRINGHLTCSIYGTIYDIWDCTNEEVTDFWIC